MKLVILLMTIACLHVSASSLAQSISLSKKDAALTDVFNSIKQQSNYRFFWKGDDLVNYKISVTLKDANIKQTMDQVLKDLPLTYTITENTIVIQKKSEPVTPTVEESKPTAPPVMLTGKVTDEFGKAMAGVTIQVKSWKSATSTDKNGEFRITLNDNNTTLLFSYVGYEPLELRAKDIGNNAVIVLKASTTNLREVVINKGYYSEKQALSTSDVTTITAKQIEEQPVTNVLSVLEGQVPGAFITQQSGAPGGAYSINIRGSGSIGSGTDPLYIVDGVPYPSQAPNIINYTLQASGTNGNTHIPATEGMPLNYLNPADIESIEVLKDADATSIYGSRAANGAIIITTKKGNPGKMKIDLSVSDGFNSPDRLPQLLNTQQYLQVRNEAFANDQIIPTISSAPDLLLWDTTRYTNWQKVLLPNSSYTNTQLNISGGNTNTQYMIGAGYNRQDAPFYDYGTPGADQKASVHFSINSASDDKKFNISLTASYVSDLNTVNPNDVTLYAVQLPPDAPSLFNPNGTFNWAPVSPGQIGSWTNPLSTLAGTDNNQTYNLVSGSHLSYAVLPSLTISASLGFTNTQSNEVETMPTTLYDPAYGITSGSSVFGISDTHTWSIEPQAEFKHPLGKGTISALVGLSFQENETSYQEIKANGFSNDALLADIGAASSLTPELASDAIYKYTAIYSRLNYNLEDKYILNLTARRDGSSRFGPGKQFADFGSAGIAWIFSKEKWMQDNAPWLSFGKLRINYGTSGNDQIGEYGFLSRYGSTYYTYQGQQGLTLLNAANPDLAWETDNKYELGLDLGLFKDRINLSADIFRIRTSNQLVVEPLSVVTGFSYIVANLPAIVQNTGIEATLNSTNIRSSNFTWTSSINLTIPRNKLLAFPNLATSTYANTLVIGQPLGVVKAYQSLGVNPTTGIYQFQSANGTPTYNPAYPNDQTALVSTLPKYYGGFSNTFRYKNVSLDVLLQFVKQIGRNQYFNQLGDIPGQEFNQYTDVLEAWQRPGDNKPFQQFSQNTSGAPYNAAGVYLSQSTLAYSDASYVRLKNLSLSYTLPKSWVNRIGLQNARLFIQGENLLTFTNYLGVDPEEQGETLPPLKTWTIGAQLTF